MIRSNVMISTLSISMVHIAYVFDSLVIDRLQKPIVSTVLEAAVMATNIHSIYFFIVLD